MPANRTAHYYEGFLYHLLIDPALRRVRRRVRKRIQPGSSVLDVGCGTGELLLSLADRCRRLAGVEISPRMAAFARGRTRRLGIGNVAIADGDGADLRNVASRSFDYATACMVLHEMEASERLPVLSEMARVACTLVLVDYAVPLPRNGNGFLIRIIERLGGRRHHTNFRSFLRSGGLLPLLSKAGLSVEEDVTIHRKTLRLIRTTIRPAPLAR